MPGGLALALGLALTLGLGAGARAQTAAAAPGAAAASAPAPVPAAPGPALAQALTAVRAALEACEARQQKAAVSVVDSAGVLKALLATDGASSRGVGSSTAKAQTALKFGAATSALGEKAKTDRALADQLAANPAFNSRAGGVLWTGPGGVVLGAIGVGGARGSEVDEACALAGLQAAGVRP